MIKLIDILKEIFVSGKEPIGQGSQHVVYPYSKDPNKVIKTFDPSEGESINIEQIDTFQQYPNIFPIVYKVTDKYAVLEKLDVDQAVAELEKLNVEFSNIKQKSNEKRKYSILLDDIMEDDNLQYDDFIYKLYYLIKNNPSSLKSELNTLYSLTQNPNLLKKWIDFLLQIVSIFGKKDLDIHAEQFGYTPEGQIKLLDI